MGSPDFNLKGPESLDRKKQRAKWIVKKLRNTYPDSECSLTHENSFQLLIATILSAQCTDERVNKVTPALFAKFPNPQAFASASLSELEQMIRSTNFFKNKAKNIKSCCEDLVSKHKAQVPQTMQELIALAGVGRKTANVVLGNAFNVPSMVVDTHVTRLSRRMGLTKSKTAEHIEADLMDIIDKKDWVDFSHLLISHGRAICTARKAFCDECPVNSACPKRIEM